MGSSVPHGFIDDIRRIVRSVLNQLESLKIRNIYGLEEVNGVAWSGGGGGVTDHGNLDGLEDDDHLQYLMTNGIRAMSADLAMGTHKITGLVDPLTNQEAATKKYVDDNSGGVSNHASLTQLDWLSAGHTINHDIVPVTNNAHDLGSPTMAFVGCYTNYLGAGPTIGHINVLCGLDLTGHDIYDVHGLYLDIGATTGIIDVDGDMHLRVGNNKAVKIIVG